MIQPIGYLRLWREIATKPIWLNSTPEQKSILITLMMMVNFKPKQWEWKGEQFEVSEGQVVTSIDSIVKNCGKGITPQNVRTALKRFEKIGFLTNESTKTGRLITIANWCLYQSEEKNQQSNQQTPNKDLTKTSQRPNKDITPREESKKDKEGEKDIYTDEFERIYKLYPNSQAKRDTFNNYKKLLKQHTHNELENAVLVYKKKVETEKITHPYSSNNFFGKKAYYEDFINIKVENSKPKRQAKIKVLTLEE